MRKILIFLALTALLFSAFTWNAPQPAHMPQSVEPISVIESSAERLVLGLALPEMTLDDVVMADGNPYTVLSGPEAAFADPGKPAVPVFGAHILVPNGRTASLEVSPGDADIHAVNYTLSPLPLPAADLEDSPVPAFYIDEAAYAAPYPGLYAELRPIEVMRGQEMALLRLYPYQYDHAQRELHIYPNLTVTINFEGDLEPIPLNLRDPLFDELYRKEAINADDVLEAEYAIPVADDPKFGSYGWDYLIFTDPAFEAAANKLAAWKDKNGYKTLVTKIPSGWKPDDVKKALLNAYKTWDTPPKYVLLIGDAETIGPFYKTWHIYNSTPYKGKKNTQGYNATDLYYSTLQSAGTDPDADLKPEVMLGRLSVDDPYDAMDRVNAIINYEKTPPTSSNFYNTVVMAAQFQDGGTIEVSSTTGLTWNEYLEPNGTEDRRFSQTTEDIAIFLEGAPASKTVKRMYYADSNPKPAKWNDNKQQYQSWTNFKGQNTSIGGNLPSNLLASSFKWDADSLKIRTAIEAGSFLVTHRDHGGRLRWSQPAFEHYDAFLLQNANLLPVVWSLNCQTGWFDNETDFKGQSGLTDLTGYYDEGFSEYWERPAYASSYDDDYGAVGILAATRVTYGSYNARLMEGLTEAIWPQYTAPTSTAAGIFQMGAVMNYAKSYMTKKTSAASEQTLQVEGYHWFGDPSMAIRTQKPPLMAAFQTSPWPWALHRSDLTMHVDWLTATEATGGPVKKAKVTITSNEHPGDHWTALTDQEGNVLFEGLTTSGLGQYQVTVTADNHLPVTTTFQSQPGPAGGIMLNAEVYRCSSEVEVRVADSDLESSGILEGVILTSSAGDEETINLAEVEPGFFLGGLVTSASEGSDPYDGILHVTHDGIITAIYADADDGSDAPAEVVDEAQIDCQAPVFDGLAGITVNGCYAHLAWGEASDPHGLIFYDIYRSETPSELGERIASTWGLSYPDFACSNGGTLYYSVRARDALGNTDENSVQENITLYGYFLPLVAK